jgi:hypothetical protein
MAMVESYLEDLSDNSSAETPEEIIILKTF